MFDDLRQQAASAYEEEKNTKVEQAAPKKSVAAAPRPKRKSKTILGMTGPQRFAVSFMLMLMVCITGFMFLFMMGKMGF